MSQAVRRFGSSLARMGFKKGDVLGLVSPNVPEFPIAMFGAAGVGMPVALVNPAYTPGKYYTWISMWMLHVLKRFAFCLLPFPEEIARQMNLVGAKAIFGVSVMADHLKQVAQLCPSIQKVILLGPNQEGCASYQEMMQDTGDLFNDNIDVSNLIDSKLKPTIKLLLQLNGICADRSWRRYFFASSLQRHFW